MKSTHKRNLTGLGNALRCGAKTRTGRECRSPAVRGKKRCRMHGGSRGSGAPAGNKSALRTGLHTKEAIELRKHIAKILRESELIIDYIYQK
ncbi:HGGxSTG domain-containing protein [Croceicoccus mobilis]|uniref:HGGxSTG domain-containing protein n=1 Tax=Croceicoccus mobilis TaxID=1703339 RepID=UPI0009EEB286